MATINEIYLVWTDNSDNELGFVVERCLEQTTGKGKNRVTSCDFVQYGTTSADSTSLTITTESGYNYRVKAVNKNGDSAYTNNASI